MRKPWERRHPVEQRELEWSLARSGVFGRRERSGLSCRSFGRRRKRLAWPPAQGTGSRKSGQDKERSGAMALRMLPRNLRLLRLKASASRKISSRREKRHQACVWEVRSNKLAKRVCESFAVCE